MRGRATSQDSGFDALAGRCPRVATTAAVTVAVWVSLAPSLLPRPALAQAAVSGCAAAAAAGAAGLCRRRNAGSACPAARLVALLAAAVALGWTVLAAAQWQDGLRAAMGRPPTGPAHWIVVCVCSSCVLGAVRVLGRVRETWRRAGVRAAAATAVAVMLGAVAAVAPVGAGQVYPDAAPVAATTAGGPSSLVAWQSLGDEGRRFVSADARAIRTYVGLESAPDVRSRAALAVRELERAGGFARAHVVVVVPTGSGWVDPAAMRGFTSLFGGDVALVAQQYSAAPSWVTFLFDRNAAAESARALLTSVRSRIDALDPVRRPQVHVYGQSLGSIGGSAALAATVTGPCTAIWAGPPAGAVRTDGAVVTANTSDPVVWWQPSLLWSPPDLSRARRDAPVPRWLPVVSFVQATLDLPVALDAPPGHGHRYGPDQARCDRP
ncbi:alpha/beta-hydrolase family protein [Rhodococcus sp. GXMU-t2271]|uniref:Alpha/beta-hydrolase family protein n=1 Tax=Rhodococcus indonesiensis TaxID=3055869 RepID=A0ABT7RLM8_9NOCA|nr:alpha/beta-hydrolase family protein [Rhodococcus indonesiensis]MDM7488544.1 alpha/beta-hydrolase family protein [Rhodococcus indonesiensis]